ncbi:RHO1 GDP-GTP exchange protein 2 [Coemansia sp. Benny D115]|nr:RHO1 GDP-GTP exchange protein 2 [Coemansia sp. Benny D115]
MVLLPSSHERSPQSTKGVRSTHRHSAMALLTPHMSSNSGSSGSGASIAAGNPAKARMLWQEGFTPHEIANSSMDEREVRRQEVIFEIIHTEADYVRDLRMVVDILLTPMRQLRVVPAEQIALIFGNVEEILELHTRVNTAFMERQRQQYPVVWDISDVLLGFVAEFRIYAKYICNQDKALGLVAELKRTSNDFAVFCKERQRRPECRSLPMETYLGLPFQRLLKYPLLLQTLLKTTDEWAAQYANGRRVAEQIDAWIHKIQDARAKLDGYACVEALSRSIAGVDWQTLLQREDHKLMHSGAVRATNPGSAQNGGALAPEQAAHMWLFDTFVIVARTEAASGPMSMLPRASFSGSRASDVTAPTPTSIDGMPAAGTRYVLAFGPCSVVEVLELAQSKGAPAAYLRGVPLSSLGASPPQQMASIVVRFASKTDYAKWRPRLDEHVQRTLGQTPALSADILAEAIARARIVDDETDDGNSKTTGGRPKHSAPSSGMASAMASVSDIPTISVREVYVPFPAARQRGKLRRGWDFLCSKTEDITGQGIKRQLKKYGGGGGKRRATDSVLPVSHSTPLHRRLSRSTRTPRAPGWTTEASQASLLTAVVSPQSPSFVHVPGSTGPSAINGSRESTSSSLPKAAAGLLSGALTVMPQRGRRSRNQTLPALGIYHPQLEQQTQQQQHQQQQRPARASTNDFGGSVDSIVLQAFAEYSCRGSEDTARFEVGSATLHTGAADVLSDSDSDMSLSEYSAVFPEHAAERSGSTLFAPVSGNSETLPSMHGRQSARSIEMRQGLPPIPPRPPVFEVGSAKLTLGDDRPVHGGVSHQVPPGGGGGGGGGVRRTTWGSRAHELISNMPAFESSRWQASGSLPRPSALSLGPARSWQAVDNDMPSSANSTDSFYIVTHEPRQTSQRQNTAGQPGTLDPVA